MASPPAPVSRSLHNHYDNSDDDDSENSKPSDCKQPPRKHTSTHALTRTATPQPCHQRARAAPKGSAWHTLCSMPVFELEQRIAFKAVHILPPDLMLSPAFDLSLLALGTKFIPTTMHADRNISQNMDLARTFTTDSRLLTASVTPLGVAAAQQLLLPPPQPALPPAPLSERQQKLLRAALFTQLHRPTPPTRDNLTRSQRATLRALQHNPDLVVRDADKNLGLTLMSRAWYEQQIEHHLLDDTTYLPVALWRPHHQRILALIRRCYNLAWPSPPAPARRSTPNSNSNGLPCTFYVIPKVHKTPPSSRPIASASHYATTALSTRLTPYLQRMVSRLPYIVANSTVFLRQLSTRSQQSQPLPPHARLFAADVDSLYPNIETAWALQLLDAPVHSTYGAAHGDTILHALDIVLNNLFVQHGSRTFHQISGCAMGTPVAPPYANLVMHFADQQVRAAFDQQLLLLCRYIDDYFGIWLGTSDEFQQFTNAMNNLHRRIRIQFTPLARSATFLDISVSINDDGTISTSLHRKQLNRYLYIPFHSQHTRACLRGWVYAEFLRITRACSTIPTWLDQLAAFSRLLRLRGYPLAFITNIRERVTFDQRSTLLSPRVGTKPSRTHGKVILRTIYTTGVQSRHLNSTLRAHTSNGMIAYMLEPSLGRRLAPRRSATAPPPPPP